MKARADWTYTFTNIPGDDTDNGGNALIDQDKVLDPNTKVIITKGSSVNLDFGEDDTVRDYELFINDSYRVRDLVSVDDPWNLEQ